MRKLKIAQIAPVFESIPPQKYGGIERIVYDLTEELVKRGHDVTLFATADSKTSGRLVSITPKPIRFQKNVDPYGPNAITALNYGLAYQMQDQFDIIHDHLGSLSLPTANLSKTPVLMTMHGVFTPEVQELFSVITRPYIATISDRQRQMGPKKMNHIGTVYNGLDMDHYPFSNSNNGYLLFVGRITREKGVHHAVKAAEALNLPLIIAAKLEPKFQADVDYFNRYIKPKLSGKIKWVGEVSETARNKLMSKALAVLHPVTWPEPFGLTLIEAMACGCPVIAFRLGSIPEIIVNGRTGFVVSDVKGMINAIKNVKKINRAGCRTHALEKFSARAMTTNYENVYNKILDSKLKTHQGKDIFTSHPLTFQNSKELGPHHV